MTKNFYQSNHFDLLGHNLKDYGYLNNILNNSLLQNPFTPYPSEHDLKGDVFIGYTRDIPCFLNLNEIQQNILILGRAGSGKTNLNYVLLDSLLRIKPCWILETAKKDYRHLIRNFNILVIPVKDFRINPLQNPLNISKTEWDQELADVFCKVFGLYAASKSALLESLDELRKKFPDRNPTMIDLYRMLNEKRKKASRTDIDYIDRCKNKIQPFTTILKDTIDVEKGFPLEQLLNFNVVFEFTGLTIELQAFFINILLLWIYKFRNSFSGLRNIILIDEASKVFGNERETFTSEAARRMREYGIGLLISDQIFTSLQEGIIANTFGKICLSQGSGKDIKYIKETLGLTREQADVLNYLEPGQALVKLASRWPHPFLIQIPEYKIEKNVSDSEIESRMRPVLNSIPFTPAKEEVIQVDNIEKQESKLREFLLNIYNEPFVSVTERYRKLNLTAWKGNYLKDKLIKNNLAKQIMINLGGKGKSASFLEITDKGYGFLGKEKRLKGKGSFEHVFWQHKIASYYEKKGYKVTIEDNSAFKNIDVAIEKDNEKTAIETELGINEHILKNIKDDFRLGFFNKLLIATKKELMEKIREMVENLDEKDRIRIKELKDFL